MGLKILRFIDKYLFSFFIILLFWIKYLFIFNTQKHISSPKKILVIRVWALGSSLLTFNMIKSIRDYYGQDIQLDLLASSRNIGVFKNQGYFDNMFNLLKYKDFFKLLLKFKDYDIVFDTEEYFRTSSLASLWLGKINVGFSNLMIRGLAYNTKVWYNDNQHVILTSLDLLSAVGIKYTIPSKMEKLVYRLSDIESAEVLLRSYEGKKFVCMHAGGAETSPERFWSEENWTKLIEILVNQHNDVVVFLSGTAFEKTAIQNIIGNLHENYTNIVVDLTGILNLGQFAYFLEKIDVMVANDTGPMHLAACMGTSTIGLFGPNLPSRFGPYPLDKNIGLYKGDGTAYINVHLGEFKKCSTDIINSITPEEVLKEIEKFI